MYTELISYHDIRVYYHTGEYTLVRIMSTHRIGRFSHPAAQPEEFPPEAQWMDYDTLEEVLTLI